MAEHGQVWFALEQTAGKGQRGKEWKGTAAENILMSVVLETCKLTIGQQFRLSAAVAVAVRNFFAQHAGENTCIKWPNDLYWCDSKAGGILIENVIGGPRSVDGQQSTDNNVWKWGVVGIGININQFIFPESLPNPTSLCHITQKKYQMMELLNELCACLEKQWQLLVKGKWDEIYKEYNKHLYKLGKPVRLRKKNVVMPCTIRGVSKNGKLLIVEDETVRFGFGEVSWEL